MKSHGVRCSFLGHEVRLRSESRELVDYIHTKLARGGRTPVSRRKPSLRFHIAVHEGGGPIRVPASYSSPQVYFLALPGKVVATCYLRKSPWQVDLQAFGSADPDYVFDYAFGPIFNLLLKRLGTFQWHCAAVERGGKAVLLPGASGSGKSTTALTLLDCGFKLLGDDEVFVMKKGEGFEAVGTESTLFLTQDALPLFPRLDALRKCPIERRSHRYKIRFDVKRYSSGLVSRRASVHCVLFPKVTGRPKTELRSLTPVEGLSRCLKLFASDGYGAWIPDRVAVQRQIEMFCGLAQSCRAYDLLLGRDTAHTQGIVRSLL